MLLLSKCCLGFFLWVHSLRRHRLEQSGVLSWRFSLLVWKWHTCRMKITYFFKTMCYFLLFEICTFCSCSIKDECKRLFLLVWTSWRKSALFPLILQKEIMSQKCIKSNMEQILLCKRNNRYIPAGFLDSLNFHLLSYDQFFAVLSGSWYSTSGKLQLISKTYFK